MVIHGNNCWNLFWEFGIPIILREKSRKRMKVNDIHFQYRRLRVRVSSSQVQGNDRNAGKNMQNNKYKSCDNTYKKHDKAHRSSSKSILSRHISDPVYIQELYRNITIHVSSPTSHSYARQHNGAAHTHEPGQSH